MTRLSGLRLKARKVRSDTPPADFAWTDRTMRALCPRISKVDRVTLTYNGICHVSSPKICKTDGPCRYQKWAVPCPVPACSRSLLPRRVCHYPRYWQSVCPGWRLGRGRRASRGEGAEGASRPETADPLSCSPPLAAAREA